MTNFIPIFPLALIVYPGEDLNLHIFEPRYKELINDCNKNKKPFGIPSVIKNKISEIGTLVEITEISKVYKNGEMDIKTRGKKVFRTLEIIKDIPDKLYNGAIVNYPQNRETGNRLLMEKILNGVYQLHKLLNVKKKFKKDQNELWSYDIAHDAGLTVEQEYELLGLFHELQREEYLKRHLARVLPIVAEMEAFKKKVKLNGHFKELKGFKF
jgi:uncharacterized protein